MNKKHGGEQLSKAKSDSTDLLSIALKKAALECLCEITGGPKGIDTGRVPTTKERIETIEKYLREAYTLGKGTSLTRKGTHAR